MIMISLSRMIFSAEDEDDIATKLQAGYRGMRVREEMRDSGASSPEEDKVTVTESVPRVGADSGVGNSFSSREVTPRDNISVVEGRNEPDPNEDREDKDEDEGEMENEEEEEEDDEEEDDEEGEEDSEEEDDEEDSESEGEVVRGKTPFVLLKQLVGIMRLSGGVGKIKKLNPDIPAAEDIRIDTTTKDEALPNTVGDNEAHVETAQTEPGSDNIKEEEKSDVT